MMFPGVSQFCLARTDTVASPSPMSTMKFSEADLASCPLYVTVPRGAGSLSPPSSQSGRFSRSVRSTHEKTTRAPMMARRVTSRPRLSPRDGTLASPLSRPNMGD
jgi:hypothetical protein